jgi:hypothetical protein
MSGIIGQKVRLGQADGSEVELIVSGTRLYATYETPDGFPAVYDQRDGRFCYARLVSGRFESTGVPVTLPPPSDVEPHATESDDVRALKIREREQQIEPRSEHPEE